MQGAVNIALEEASLVLALISRLLLALTKTPAWGRLQPGIFRLAWLYGRLDARVSSTSKKSQSLSVRYPQC